jgi:hypothetical protein
LIDLIDRVVPYIRQSYIIGNLVRFSMSLFNARLVIMQYFSSVAVSLLIAKKDYLNFVFSATLC